MSTRVAEYLEAQELIAAAEAFTEAPSAEDAERLFDALDEIDRDEGLDVLEGSLAIARALIASRPKRDDAHLIAIECLRRLGRTDEALAIGRDHRDRPAVRSQYYQLLCLHGRYEQARALEPELAGMPQREGNALYNLGHRMHTTGALEQAVALYRGAVAVGAPEPQASVNLGIALLAAGRAQEAADSALAALAKHPNEPNLLANAIDAAVRANDVSALRTILPQAQNALGQGDRCRKCDHRQTPAACGAGCGALLEDMTNAWILLGEERAAVRAIEAASGDQAPEPKLRYALARALAAAGNVIDARSLVRGKRNEGAQASELAAPGVVALQTTPPTPADAASFNAYRAQAAVAWAAGETDKAAGALCAALFVAPGNRSQLERDASWAALRGREPSGDEPLRPPTVPAEAWWEPGDKEWVLGPRDKQNGSYKYYRPDGTCCNESALVDGKPHGPFLRFHENGAVSQEGTFIHGDFDGIRRWTGCDEATTELTRQDGMALSIWRSEMHYANGRVVEIRHFDQQGKQCAPDGTLYPERPSQVSASAAYHPQKRHWRFGEIDGERNKQGVWRTWNEYGQLLREESYLDDELHGPFRAFHPDGSSAALGEYEEGSQRGTFTYFRGALLAPAVARDDDDDDDDDDDLFPAAGARVVRIEQREGRRRYFDAQGHETLMDGRPLAEVQQDPVLGPWLADLERVDWSELESAGGQNPPGYALLTGLIAEDDPGNEKVSNAAWSALYWHFCHQGTVYTGTAAAVPFLLRLAARRQQPFRLAVFNFLRAIGGAMRHTYRQAHAESDDEGWADYLAVARAYGEGFPLYRELLDDADPAVRSWAARLVGSCHGNAEAAARALGYRLITETEAGVRGNLLQSLGALGVAGAEQLLERSLRTSGIERICAGIGMVMCKGEETSIEAVAALISSMAEADSISDAFDELPWSESDIHAELANSLAQTGRAAAVLDDIVAKLDSVDALSAISVAQSALSIAQGLAGDEDDEDSQGDGGAAMRKVAGAIAAADQPWTFNVNLHEVLEAFDLPTDREELAALARGQEDEAAVGEAEEGEEDESWSGKDEDDAESDDSDEDEDEESDEDDADDEEDEDEDDDAADESSEDEDADEESDDEDEEDEDDDAADESSEDEDADEDAADEDAADDEEASFGALDLEATASLASAPAASEAPPADDDFQVEDGSHTSPTRRIASARPTFGEGDLDDEIDRSLGFLDESAPEEGSSEAFVPNALPPDEETGTSRRATPRHGSEGWLSDVGGGEDDDEDSEEDAELGALQGRLEGSMDTELEDPDPPSGRRGGSDDGWNN